MTFQKVKRQIKDSLSEISQSADNFSLLIYYFLSWSINNLIRGKWKTSSRESFELWVWSSCSISEAFRCLHSVWRSAMSHWCVCKPAGFTGSCFFSDRKWRHLSAWRYNGEHIAVTLGSLYQQSPPTSPLWLPPQLLLSAGRRSGQQQHHNHLIPVCRSTGPSSAASWAVHR